MLRRRIATFYFVLFCAVGIGLPWMPQVLKARGLTSPQVGFALALSPFCAMVFPPLWGQLADRTRRHGLVLAVLTLGMALGTLGTFFTTGFLQVTLCMLLGAIFGSSVSTLADTLAMHAAVESGASFSRVRVFGSLGFIAAAATFGLAVHTVDDRTLLVIFGCQVAAGLFALVLLRGAATASPPGSSAGLPGLKQVLLSKGVRGLLAASALHWVACAPYHGVFGPHVKAQGFDNSVVGISAAIGVASEVLVMVTWPRWAHRVRLPVLLAICFAASGARWVLTAHAGPVGLCLLGLLHGLTFAAFYVAAVGWMATAAPPALRASAQSLFVSATFGFGGMVGYLLSGWLWERVGTPRLFELAGAFELVPLGLALWLWRMNGERSRPKPA